MNNRCYLRGWTPLGLFNTAIGCLFNRVLVRHIDTETRKTVEWSWGVADEHPPIKWLRVKGAAPFEIQIFHAPFEDNAKPNIIPLAAETLNDAYLEMRELVYEHLNELGDEYTTATHIRYMIIFFLRDRQTVERWHLEDNRPQRQAPFTDPT